MALNPVRPQSRPSTRRKAPLFPHRECAWQRAPCLLAGLLLVRWKINLLSMGDDEARALGIRTEWLKGLVIACATLITSAAVSACGVVGWVGLVIPHVARTLVGPDHRDLLPATLSLGASYLLLIDGIARTATTIEIPIGILTSIIGAPFFAYLLRRTSATWR